MIDVYCTSAALNVEMRRAFTGTFDDVLYNDWSAFGDREGHCDCSVVVVAKPMEQRIVDLLRLLATKSQRGSSARAILFVEDTLTVREACPFAPPSNVIITRKQLRDTLLESISREASRAALAHMQYRILGETGAHAPLRRSIASLLEPDSCTTSVRAVAKLCDVNESTLHHYWISDGIADRTRLTLKQFLDVVVLLKARAQKAPGDQWVHVAATQKTSARHLQDVSRRMFGSWFGDRNHHGWISVVRYARELATALACA